MSQVLGVCTFQSRWILREASNLKRHFRSSPEVGKMHVLTAKRMLIELGRSMNAVLDSRQRIFPLHYRHSPSFLIQSHCTTPSPGSTLLPHADRLSSLHHSPPTSIRCKSPSLHTSYLSRSDGGLQVSRSNSLARVGATTDHCQSAGMPTASVELSHLPYLRCTAMKYLFTVPW